jgi:phage-related protein
VAGCVYADFLRLMGLLEEGGLDLRMPHSRAMKDGLFELRCKEPEGISRAFCCMQVGRELVILHRIIKKTQATPAKDLELARKRQKEVKS